MVGSSHRASPTFPDVLGEAIVHQKMKREVLSRMMAGTGPGVNRIFPKLQCPVALPSTTPA
jgi:hypothetical protein